MSWVVYDMDHWVGGTRTKLPSVAMNSSFKQRRTILIDGETVVIIIPSAFLKSSRDILWTIHPKNRMKQYKRPDVRATKLNTDFRPWQQQKYFTI